MLWVDEQRVGQNSVGTGGGIDTILYEDFEVYGVLDGIHIVDQIVGDLDIFQTRPVLFKPPGISNLERRIEGENVIDDPDILQIHEIQLAPNRQPILGIAEKVMSQSFSIECVVVHFDILPGIIGAPPREEYSARPVVVHQVMMNVQVLCIMSLLRRDRYSCFTSGDDVIVHLDVL